MLIDENKTKHTVIKILRERLDLIESWVERNGDGWDDMVADRLEDEAIDMKERTDDDYQHEIYPNKNPDS